MPFNLMPSEDHSWWKTLVVHMQHSQIFSPPSQFIFNYLSLSYDVASESEITPFIKIDKPLVVYRFGGNVMKIRF